MRAARASRSVRPCTYVTYLKPAANSPSPPVRLVPGCDGCPQGEPEQPAPEMGGMLVEIMPALTSTARRLMGPNLRQLVDPGDLVQSALLSLVQGCRSGKCRVDDVSELMRCACLRMRHIAARLARKTRQHLQISLPDAPEAVLAARDAGSQSPIARSEAREILEKLRPCFDERSWSYIQLHYVEGYSASDAARRVGLTVKAVQKRIERQRAALPYELVQLAVSLLGRVAQGGRQVRALAPRA